MENKFDSTTLFLTQLSGHAEELGGLLAVRPDEQIENDRVERSILSTSMLASSASLMEMGGLEAVLSSYGQLLAAYRDKRLPWDERIAQVTSEIIEKEDQFTAAAVGLPASQLQDAMGPGELAPLLNELKEIHGYAAKADPVPEPQKPTPVPQQMQPTPVPAPTPAAAPPQVATPAQTAPPPSPELSKLALDEDRPLGKSMNSLRRHAQKLLDHWQSSDWTFTGGSAGQFEDIRRQLFLLNYYALSIEQIIGIKTDDASSPTIETLAPVRATIEDFARVLCAETNRRIDFSFNGEDQSLDVRLLPPVVKVLQCMIGDISARCNDEYLHIEVSIEERYGRLQWSLRDNGNNFITDSRLDPDEYLAFYPGLKTTSRVLSDLRSLLWVEPDENHDTRFAFTIPVSPDGSRFMTWGSDKSAFAVHANQIGDVLPIDVAAPKSDSHGEFITRNGNRVALVKLGHLYKGAPAEGDRIVIIGCLEKRIAFYATGDGEVKDGEWLKNAIPVWRGLGQGIAQFGKKKMPLLDANDLLKNYIKIINTTGDVSGGLGDNDSDLSETETGAQKSSKVSVAKVSTGDSEVLVIERSEALRETFAAIFSQNQIATTIVGELDAAVSYLKQGKPTLIISEFRVPSMAAKVLVETLRQEGKRIPVLVTTAHRGENAQLLVEKLGAAGYISKPLCAPDILDRVDGFVQPRQRQTQKT